MDSLSGSRCSLVLDQVYPEVANLGQAILIVQICRDRRLPFSGLHHWCERLVEFCSRKRYVATCAITLRYADSTYKGPLCQAQNRRGELNPADDGKSGPPSGGACPTLSSFRRLNLAVGNDIALRISSLEPEHYTRAGAAIRHATASLMQQSASHRLLLLLSDGKPNDVDEYEGRYGAEDMRQAVNEARLQGLSPFCLTIDRQAAGYLPRIFGANQYAMLSRPELLPTVLLDWMRRLLAARQG